MPFSTGNLSDYEKIQHRRGLRQQTLVRLWNESAPWKHYEEQIAWWVMEEGRRVEAMEGKAYGIMDVEPDFVIIPVFKRRPETDEDKRIAEYFRFDFEADQRGLPRSERTDLDG